MLALSSSYSPLRSNILHSEVLDELVLCPSSDDAAAPPVSPPKTVLLLFEVEVEVEPELLELLWRGSRAEPVRLPSGAAAARVVRRAMRMTFMLVVGEEFGGVDCGQLILESERE